MTTYAPPIQRVPIYVERGTYTADLHPEHPARDLPVRKSRRLPPPGEGADGDVCTADGDCAGLFCVLEEWGWPGGYCSGYCEESSPCAGGGGGDEPPPPPPTGRL